MPKFDAGAMDDYQWFSDHPERLTRIREPFSGEYAQEFEMLGIHSVKRRRIITWKMIAMGNVLGRIPFLMNNDETIENEDRILVPILDALMKNEIKRTAN